MTPKDFHLFCAALAVACSLAFFAVASRASDCTTPTHCALMELTPWHEDREEENRSERVQEIADAVDAATVDDVERAFLARIAYEESRLARFVHLDEPKCRLGKGGWCDDGSSYSPWQLKRMTRTETAAESAVVALDRYRKGLNACGSIEGAISMYATGKTCSWKEAAAREKAMWRMHWRMTR